MLQSVPPVASRRLCLSLAALIVGALLSACSSTGTGEGLEETAASVAPPPAPGNTEPSAFAAMGEPSPYCPKVQVRDGTGILDKETGGNLAYSANIIGAQSTCRIVDGQLRMKVDVGGRIAPGPAGPGAVELPLRIAVLRGDDVIYSELGRVPTSASGSQAQNFTYSDDRIAFAKPGEQNITVFTGFDEGPPQ